MFHIHMIVEYKQWAVILHFPRWASKLTEIIIKIREYGVHRIRDIMNHASKHSNIQLCYIYHHLGRIVLAMNIFSNYPIV
jgi:hypothetical protein